MGQQAEVKNEVREADFYGLVTALDEHDLPPGGAQDLVNMTIEISGKLVSRRGYLPLQFEDLC